MTRWIIRCTSAWLMLVTLAGPAAAEWVLWKIETTLSLSNKTRQEPRDAFDTKALCMTNAQQRLATAGRPDRDLYYARDQLDGAPGFIARRIRSAGAGSTSRRWCSTSGSAADPASRRGRPRSGNRWAASF